MTLPEIPDTPLGIRCVGFRKVRERESVDGNWGILDPLRWVGHGNPPIWDLWDPCLVEVTKGPSSRPGIRSLHHPRSSRVGEPVVPQSRKRLFVFRPSDFILVLFSDPVVRPVTDDRDFRRDGVPC